MSYIYLDNAATTPLSPEVVEAMVPFLERHYGNPSSLHRYGRQARNAIESARDRIAQALHVEPAEIVFTSGGTEADNQAITGCALQDVHRRHIICTEVEHHAVLRTVEFLESLGWAVTRVPVDRNGFVHPQEIEAAIRPDTAIVSVMAANNEVGSIQDIEHIGAIAREHGAPMHSDAVQALGVLDLDVPSLPVDLMSLSSHKVHGPKGVGALYIRRGTELQSIVHGGVQERGRRGGTENVAGIVGFATALDIAVREREEKYQYLSRLRSRMLDGLRRQITDVRVHTPDHSLPTILHVAFIGVSAETLLMRLDLSGVAASSGSACTAGSMVPSHVLQAMKVSDDEIRSSVRFSFSKYNTVEEIDEAVERIAATVRDLQQRST